MYNLFIVYDNTSSVKYFFIGKNIYIFIDVILNQ